MTLVGAGNRWVDALQLSVIGGRIADIGVGLILRGILTWDQHSRI